MSQFNILGAPWKLAVNESADSPGYQTPTPSQMNPAVKEHSSGTLSISSSPEGLNLGSPIVTKKLLDQLGLTQRPKRPVMSSSPASTPFIPAERHSIFYGDGDLFYMRVRVY